MRAAFGSGQSCQVPLVSDSEEADEEIDQEEEDEEEDYVDDDEGFKGPRKRGRKSSAVKANATSQTRAKKMRAKRGLNFELSESLGEDPEEIDEDAISGACKVESGHILRIYVENFMCHRKMTVDFGRHVNFVTGENGSGKSAIVVAIQLCLGGSARITGRGQSLATLIREGSDGPAILRVTLHNVGADAYKSDLYGTHITIERKITKSGLASYRIMSGFGSPHDQVVSTQKRELNAILTQFNIFVDNPVNVLTQEESKKFIQGQEKDKYLFFLKATGLEKARQSLIKFEEDLESSRKCVPAIAEKCEVKEEVYKKLKAELKELEALDRYEADIVQLKSKLLWLDVYNADAEMEALNDTIGLKREALGLAQQSLLEAEQVVSGIGSIEEIRERIDNVRSQCEDVQTEVNMHRTSFNDKAKVLNALQTSLKQLQTSATDFSNRIKATTREIKDLRERALAGSKGQEAEIIANMEATTRAISDLVGREAELRNQRREISSEQDRLRRDEAQCTHQIRSRTSELSTCENELRELSSAGNSTRSRAIMFGRQIPGVLSKIARTQFRGPVLGPLGMEVVIRDGCEGMTGAIERAIGGSLNAFVVTNQADEFELSRILKEEDCARAHQIIRTTVEARYNIPTIEGVTAVADAITIANDLVYNVLADRWGITQKIIVPTENEVIANYVVQRERRSEWRHPQIREAYTYDGTSINISYGNYISEVNRFPTRNCLAKDSSAIVRQLNDRIVDMRESIKELQSQQAEYRGSIDHVSAQMEAMDREMRSINEKMRRSNKQKMDYENQLNEMRDIQAIDTTDQEDELRELEAALNTVTDQIGEKNRQIQTAKEEHLNAQRDKKLSEDQLEQLKRQMEGYEREIQKYINTVADAKRIEEKARKEVATKQLGLDELIKQLDNKTASRNALAETVTIKTTEMMPDWDGRPPILTRHDTEPKLRGKLKATQDVLEKEKANAGLAGRSKASVTAKLQDARLQRDRCREELQQLISNIEALDKDFNDRKKSWTKQMKASCIVVREAFDKYMQDKGQSGTVQFDHKEQTLTLLCQTDNMDQSTLRADVRQLSGGERSFTTLCLLLALGHVIECPFRVLDEYDVFLDEISRKMTLSRLLTYSKEDSQIGRQMIIITPHNLRGITTTNDVRIKKMAAPERSTTRGAQQTTL